MDVLSYTLLRISPSAGDLIYCMPDNRLWVWCVLIMGRGHGSHPDLLEQPLRLFQFGHEEIERLLPLQTP